MTLKHVIELVQLRHPELGQTLLTKLINNATIRFVKESYCLPTMSKMEIGAASVSLDGSSYGSPVTLEAVDDTLSLLAYKDDTVDTVTVQPSTSVLYYTNLVCRNRDGEVIESLSVSIQDDGTIYFYDQNRNPISEFPSDVWYLDIYYIKKPTVVTDLDTDLSIDDDYCEAIAHFIIGDYYVGKKGVESIQALTWAKHFKNLYQEQVLKAKTFYHKRRSLMPISGVVTEELQED